MLKNPQKETHAGSESLTAISSQTSFDQTKSFCKIVKANDTTTISNLQRTNKCHEKNKFHIKNGNDPVAEKLEKKKDKGQCESSSVKIPKSHTDICETELKERDSVTSEDCQCDSDEWASASSYQIKKVCD